MISLSSVIIQAESMQLTRAIVLRVEFFGGQT